MATASALVYLLLFIVAGSRPRFAGRERSARSSWGFLRRYHAEGWSARVAGGLPLGWAVGELADVVGLAPATAFTLAMIVAGLAWTIAPSLTFAIGVLALAVETAALIMMNGDVPLRVAAVLGAAVLLAGCALMAFRVGVRNAPLVLAAVLDLGVMWIGATGQIELWTGLVVAVVLVAIVALIASAPDLVLALLGVALAVANVAVLVIAGPAASPDLLVGLAGMAGVVPVALVLRFVPRSAAA